MTTLSKRQPMRLLLNNCYYRITSQLRKEYSFILTLYQQKP